MAVIKVTRSVKVLTDLEVEFPIYLKHTIYFDQGGCTETLHRFLENGSHSMLQTYSDRFEYTFETDRWTPESLDSYILSDRCQPSSYDEFYRVLSDFKKHLEAMECI